MGRIRLVIFDDRDASSTQGQLAELELGRPDAYVRLTIPPGLWYGFTCISALPALIANCTDLLHMDADSEQRPYEGSGIPFTW